MRPIYATALFCALSVTAWATTPFYRPLVPQLSSGNRAEWTYGPTRLNTEALQALLSDHITFSGETGTAATLVSPDGETWSGAAGLSDIETSTPMTADMQFRVGSNTKLMLAIVLMQLVDEGKLNLDAPLKDFVSGYSRWKNITVRQLLRMRSGIPEYFMNKLFWAAALVGPSHVFSPHELLAFVRWSPFDFKPGSQCGYSNSNYILLGLIAEKIAGKPAHELIEERITRPLKLQHTFLDTTGEKVPALAEGYIDFALASPLMGIPGFLAYLIPEEHLVGDRLFKTSYFLHPSATWTAGGAISTTSDMTRLVRALFEGSLVSERALAQMTQFQDCTVLTQKLGYGLGVMNIATSLGPAYGHGGLNFGYETYTFYVPGRHLALSQMHNFFPENTEAVLDTLLTTAMSDQKLSACHIPKGFFDDKSDLRLSFRFKGILKRESEEPSPGLGHFSAILDDSREPYSGSLAKATLKKGPGGQPYVELLSLAPVKDGKSAKMAVVTLDPNLFASATPGTVIRPAGTQSFTLLSDLSLYAKTSKPRKNCITAITDYTQSSDFSLCENEPAKITEHETLRLFGKVPLTTDPTTIQETLQSLGIPTCTCYDHEGKSTPCRG